MTEDIHKPCPHCNSSDAYVEYEDGGYCYSCETKTFNDENNTEKKYMRPKESKTIGSLTQGVFGDIKDRKISKDVCKKYDITLTGNKNDGIVAHHYGYYANGEREGVKTRVVKNKQFKSEGNMSNVMLFGQQSFRAGGRCLTITEGELDAASVFVLNGGFPAVSVRSSSTAVKDCRNNFEYINSFDKVVLCFDSDDPGQKAAKKVAELFPGKVRLMRMTKFKDSSDYLVNGANKEWNKEFWEAGEVMLGGFLMGDALLKAMARPVVRGAGLCWDALSKVTYGVRMHELWTFGAGSGMGKSEIFKEFMYHLTTTEDSRCGAILLEETPAKTAFCVHGKGVYKRLQLEEYAETRLDIVKGSEDYEKISKNLIIVDHKGVSDLHKILDKITYLVVALGCKYIFLDHITAICEGKDEGNVNSVMHHAMEELNKLLQRYEFTIFMISHLNQPTGTAYEEGGRVTLRNFYGSGAIKQRSNFVFGLEGNQQGEGEEKHHRQLRCLKDRETGEATGQVINLKYDHETGRFEEHDLDQYISGSTSSEDE